MPAPHAEIGNNRLSEAKLGRTELSGEGGFGNERLSDKRFPLPGFVLVYSNSITAIGEARSERTLNLSVESVNESEALGEADVPDSALVATLNPSLTTGQSPLPRLVTQNVSDVASYSSEVYLTRNSSVAQSAESGARAVTNIVGSSLIVSLVRYPSGNGIGSIAASNIHSDSAGESIGTGLSDVPLSTSFVGINESTGVGDSPIPRITTDSRVDVSTSPVFVGLSEADVITHIYEAEATSFASILRSSSAGVSFTRDVYADAIGFVAETDLRIESVNESTVTASPDIPQIDTIGKIDDSVAKSDSPLPRLETQNAAQSGEFTGSGSIANNLSTITVNESAYTSFGFTVKSQSIISLTQDVSGTVVGDTTQTKLNIESVSESTTTGSAPQLSSTYLTSVDESYTTAIGDMLITSTVSTVDPSIGWGRSGIAEIDVDTVAIGGSSMGESQLPIVSTRAPTDNEATFESTVFSSRTSEIISLDDSNAEATAGLANTFAIGVSHPPEVEAEGDASVGVTSYDALLGGTVNFGDDSGAVEGAEVHILRDNDDTKVASTTTDSNGEWSVVLPGQEYNDPDPPVFSIEVWYRDGPKRDPNSTIYHALNRPYLDTDDPSETSPYDKYYYKG